MPKHLRPYTDKTEADTGEAAAAAKNQQIQARKQILQALQRLGVPFEKYPEPVRQFATSPEAQAEFHESIILPPFQPPPWERLHETARQYIKKTTDELRAKLETSLKPWENLITMGIDEEITIKSRRGAGRKGTRLNAPPDLRADWVARRLMGDLWKQIADDRHKEDQVKKAATELLKVAGWLQLVKQRN